MHWTWLFLDSVDLSLKHDASQWYEENYKNNKEQHFWSSLVFGNKTV